MGTLIKSVSVKTCRLPINGWSLSEANWIWTIGFYFSETKTRNLARLSTITPYRSWRFSAGRIHYYSFHVLSQNLRNVLKISTIVAASCQQIRTIPSSLQRKAPSFNDNEPIAVWAWIPSSRILAWSLA